MNLSKTSKIIIGLLVVLIITLTLWLLFFYKKQTIEPNISETEGATTTPANVQDDFSKIVKNIEPNISPENVAVAVVAKRFAGRIGSYSLNKKDADPMFDLLPLVTPRAKAMAEEYYAKLEQKPTPFYGISSKTASVKLVNSGENEAVIDIALIQSEQDSGGLQIATYQSNLTLELLKVNNSWLVDSFIWN